jgi:hypothetical protein
MSEMSPSHRMTPKQSVLTSAMRDRYLRISVAANIPPAAIRRQFSVGIFSMRATTMAQGAGKQRRFPTGASFAQNGGTAWRCWVDRRPVVRNRHVATCYRFGSIFDVVIHRRPDPNRKLQFAYAIHSCGRRNRIPF